MRFRPADARAGRGPHGAGLAQLEALAERWPVDDTAQADAVLETKLYRLAKLEIQKIRDELEAKRKEAKRIQGILRSKVKFANLVKNELTEVMEGFADSRRTRISADDLTEEFSAESFIVDEDAVVLVTRDGWVKRQRSKTKP